MRSLDRPDNPARGQGSIAIWILLALTLAAFLGPPLLRGEVIYPHDNSAESGHPPVPPTGLDLSYQDVVTLYVPEQAAHLAGDHDSWLATWNPHNELGRPLFQAYVGPTFLLAHVLSWWSSDPFVHYTWMAVLAVVLTAILALGFLLLKGIHPLAAWAGAVGISVGPLYPSWGMLPLVQWGYCWAFGCLLFFERWMRNPRRRELAALGFCVHAILLTGFPQHVLGLGWMVAGWMLLRIFGSPAALSSKRRQVGALTLVTLLALLSVTPSFLDLFLAWQESTRAESMPALSEVFENYSLRSLFLAATEDGLPSSAASFSLGPLYSILALIGATRFRSYGYWILWALILVLGLEFSAFFGVFTSLGMSFSRWHPIFLLHLPATILAAVGIDRILRLLVPHGSTAKLQARRRLQQAFALLLAILVLNAAAGVPRQLLVWQPRESIKTDSELAQVLRAETADGSRFAIVGKRPRAQRWLPPNMEVLLDLRSLHSYYHVPSRSFHAWVQPLRFPEQVRPYDRRFLQVTKAVALGEEVLALAGLSTLVSFRPLPKRLVSETQQVGSVYVSRVRRPGPLQALLPSAKALGRDGLELEFSSKAVRSHALGARVDTGVHDRIELDFEPSPEEQILFLSQQYHPHWVAHGVGGELATVRINGLFQGVVIPAGSSAVELRFLPNARWMWLPQVLFGLGLLASMLASIRRRVRR